MYPTQHLKYPTEVWNYNLQLLHNNYTISCDNYQHLIPTEIKQNKTCFIKIYLEKFLLILILFICGLFNHAVSSSDYIVSDDMI
jgi:hypothetical protein